jgi:Spy/CpxP family protein refolding chaperone
MFMRKSVVFAALLVLALSAAAFAWNGGGLGPCWDDGPGGPGDGPGRMMGRGLPGGEGPEGGMGIRGWRDAPAEIRDVARELQRARLELRLALTDEKVDAAKAKALFEKQLALADKIARWRFQEELKRAGQR